MTHETLIEQLTWDPKLAHGVVPSGTPIVVGGMGGSALPAFALRFLDPSVPVTAHRDYDLPEAPTRGAWYVALSYSGNTEETLSFAHAAQAAGYPLAVITAGGSLGDFAKEHDIPTVLVPTGLQPRNALVYQVRALAALIGRTDLLADIAAVTFDKDEALSEARRLENVLVDRLPLWYSSRRNGFLAYLAKIQCNETAKMPAVANLFSELNHNEMQSYDCDAPETVDTLLRPILLRDPGDDERISRRMDVFTSLLLERGRVVTDLGIGAATRATQLVRTDFIVDQAARALAVHRGVDPDTVAFIEEFKARL